MSSSIVMSSPVTDLLQILHYITTPLKGGGCNVICNITITLQGVTVIKV